MKNIKLSAKYRVRTTVNISSGILLFTNTLHIHLEVAFSCTCICFFPVFTAISSIQYDEHSSLLAPSVFSNYQGVELDEFERMDNVTSETFAHTSKPISRT